MKKWLYVISVGGLTILFSIFYFSSRKEAEAKDVARQKAAVERQVQADADKKAAEEKARIDAEQRAAVRAAEEKAKEDEKRRKWEDDGKKIQDDIDAYTARADKASKQSAGLEIELDTLRKQREKLNREAFDTAKLVERAEVEKQNAENQTQFLLAQIVDRAANSAIAHPPAPPAPPAK